MHSLALYRHCLRLGRRAVEFKHPQVTVLRAVLRKRFAGPRPDEPRIANTLQFLHAAAHTAGLERRCLATMVHCAASQHRRAQTYERSPALLRHKELVEANARFYAAIVDGLNESMGLCL